jgi:hypothetical protein
MDHWFRNSGEIGNAGDWRVDLSGEGSPGPVRARKSVNNAGTGGSVFIEREYGIEKGVERRIVSFVDETEMGVQLLYRIGECGFTGAFWTW